MDPGLFHDQVSGRQKSNDESVCVHNRSPVDITTQQSAHGIADIVIGPERQDVGGHDLADRDISQHESSVDDQW
jgi:hypothetical protein